MPARVTPGGAPPKAALRRPSDTYAESPNRDASLASDAGWLHRFLHRRHSPQGMSLLPIDSLHPWAHSPDCRRFAPASSGPASRGWPEDTSGASPPFPPLRAEVPKGGPNLGSRRQSPRYLDHCPGEGCSNGVMQIDSGAELRVRAADDDAADAAWRNVRRRLQPIRSTSIRRKCGLSLHTRRQVSAIMRRS